MQLKHNKLLRVSRTKRKQTPIGKQPPSKFVANQLNLTETVDIFTSIEFEYIVVVYVTLLLNVTHTHI